MNNDNISIEDYFTYYPPKNLDRVLKHNKVNDKCLELALLFMNSIEDENCRVKAIDCLQQARMFANQGITVDELRKSRKNDCI